MLTEYRRFKKKTKLIRIELESLRSKFDKNFVDRNFRNLQKHDKLIFASEKLTLTEYRRFKKKIKLNVTIIRLMIND